ncbi:MAG: cell division protein FtsW [Proteobacteria bacterium]|nr:cell division protein FtsW [Pseudomonadota bacterium]
MKMFRLSGHPLVRWWWSIDRTAVFVALGLMLLGLVIVTTASSGVATDYDVDPYYFARRQLLFFALSFPFMLLITWLSPRGVRNTALVLFILAAIGVVATLFTGEETKGATRWIRLGPLGAVQPSEFLKPAFVILTAWLMSGEDGASRMKGFLTSMGLLAVMCALFMLQPNFAMVAVFGLVWWLQCFICGAPLRILVPMVLMGPAVLALAYTTLPHVKSRIQRFIDPTSGDTFQVDQAREAFMSGGFMGRGPGEGVVKQLLPDAHTDFIFAVVGEEFGIIACMILLVLYGVLFWRSFSRLMSQEDRFILLAGSGLLVLFGVQILVNVGVALHILPTTGMSLPFISYGGSSMLALSIVMGYVLALTRKGGKHVVKSVKDVQP